MISSAAIANACDILLVDDEPVIRNVLALALQREGYSVRSATDGRQALAVLAWQTVRLIVTDIFMPGTDGFEFLTQLRGHSLPIIAVSGGFAVDADLYPRVARHLGATHLLAKPFGLQEFLALVRATIGAPAAAPGSAASLPPPTNPSTST